MEECFFEVILYNAKKWWSIFDAFNITGNVGIGIRYDNDYYIVWHNGNVKKIAVRKLSEHITWSEKKLVSCRVQIVGKIWLENCLYHNGVFSTGEEFLTRYLSIMTGVKSAKPN